MLTDPGSLLSIALLALLLLALFVSLSVFAPLAFIFLTLFAQCLIDAIFMREEAIVRLWGVSGEVGISDVRGIRRDRVMRIIVRLSDM